MSNRSGRNHYAFKHGAAVRGAMTTEYRIWLSMKQRCTNPKTISYRCYGALGVTVCSEWSHSFERFLSDMGPRPSPHHSLDRYPNKDGGYEPGNVRWATRIEQNNNSARNRIIAAFGKSLTISQWARSLGINRGALQKRIARGLAPEDALTAVGLRRVTNGGRDGPL